MYYCGSDSTWASVTDLYDRYGGEFVDKLSTRRFYDADAGQYVADESAEGRLRVVSLALCDAKQMILQKLSCLYSNIEILNDNIFMGLKQWHIRATISVLKANGDCYGCDCIDDLDKFLKCGNICTEDGVCLNPNTTFISVSAAKFCCEKENCGCC